MIRHHEATERARRAARARRRDLARGRIILVTLAPPWDIHITTENQAGVGWQRLEVGTHRRSAFVTLAALAAARGTP